MKKFAAICCMIMLVTALTPTQSEAKNENRQPGGAAGFFVGCCMGLRVGTEWNEGADLHWREWAVLIPYVGGIFAIWNGVDCASGITAHDWAQANGANWY